MIHVCSHGLNNTIKDTNKSSRVKTVIKQSVFEQHTVNKIPFAQLTGDNTKLPIVMSWSDVIYKFAPFREEVVQDMVRVVHGALE